MAAEEYYIFTGREAVPPDATRVRIDESLSVIPARAFEGLPKITELDCHIGVKKVEKWACCDCLSLRLVIMPGVEEVEGSVFRDCEALTDVECGKLEIIGGWAFEGCESLRSIKLPSAMIVERGAFRHCTALKKIKVGKELTSIGWAAFYGCTSLERITLPLKDGMINDDDIFIGCANLKHVDLVEGAVLHTITSALQMEEWKNVMNEEIASINQILSSAPCIDGDARRKARAIQTWIRSVLHKIVQYKAEHRYLNEAAITLQLALPNDIVIKNVLPFLELPSHTFQGED
eukprot:scaffold1914_cov132-Skeletonema_dohrnii-CCMP3373.AAC.1